MDTNNFTSISFIESFQNLYQIYIKRDRYIDRDELKDFLTVTKNKNQIKCLKDLINLFGDVCMTLS